jgi:hypothetical protein
MGGPSGIRNDAPGLNTEGWLLRDLYHLDTGHKIVSNHLTPAPIVQRMFTIPGKRAAGSHNADRLMTELGKVEGQLKSWISRSETNARLFREDPISAMRSAGLSIEDDLICELEMIMRGIAIKLR